LHYLTYRSAAAIVAAIDTTVTMYNKQAQIKQLRYMGGGSGGMIAGDSAETDTAADELLLAELAEGDFDTDSNVVEVYTHLYTTLY
jgi:hypothetical protein